MQITTLVRGDIDTFMGFKFIASERLGVLNHANNNDAITDESCFCWAKSGIQLGIGADVKASIAPRADKSFSTYIYYSMCIGATRLEEKKIVEIACDPSAGIT